VKILQSTAVRKNFKFLTVIAPFKTRRERKCARAVLRLAQQFHGDSGAMAPLFLNYLLIAPGESFFMAANEPHAYVAGEIIECMACSDNVVRSARIVDCEVHHSPSHTLFGFFLQVRAGLTPKFKDVRNLVNMLTYSMGGPSIDAGVYMAENTDVIRYTPPCPEFEVMVLTIEPGHSLTYKNPQIPSVLIILEGSGYLDGKLCRPGRSYYWPTDADDLEFSVEQSRRGPMKVALAHKNRHVDRPTAVNRYDFGGASSHRVSVPASPMPYLGMGGRSPASNQQQRLTRDLEKDANAALPQL
jgi:mannose-6-phosphate isomerase